MNTLRPAPLPEELRDPARDLAAGVAAILTALSTLVSRRLRRTPLLALYIRPISHLLNRTISRFARRMARLADPRPLPAPRTAIPGTVIPRPPRAEPAAPPARPRRFPPVPRAPGWLIRAIVNEAACYRSQLETILASREAQAILAAHPAALRILAPVRRLIHIRPYVPPMPGRSRPPRRASPLLWHCLPPPLDRPMREMIAPA